MDSLVVISRAGITPAIIQLLVAHLFRHYMAFLPAILEFQQLTPVLYLNSLLGLKTARLVFSY